MMGLWYVCIYGSRSTQGNVFFCCCGPSSLYRSPCITFALLRIFLWQRRLSNLHLQSIFVGYAYTHVHGTVICHSANKPWPLKSTAFLWLPAHPWRGQTTAQQTAVVVVPQYRMFHAQEGVCLRMPSRNRKLCPRPNLVFGILGSVRSTYANFCTDVRRYFFFM